MKPLAFLQRWSTPFAWAVVVGLLVGCNMPAPQSSSATLDVTQAYRTVEARLTAANEQTTPKPQPTTAPTLPAPSTPLPASATSAPAPSKTPDLPPTATLPSLACDRAQGGADIDITIPDDTIMKPGEAFTKIWRLTNTGSCAWTVDYDLVWFSGELLSAPKSVPLEATIAPGQTVDLAVDMVAPPTAGTYQSNWKLRNAAGILFGIGPNSESSFWVRIIVNASTTVTATSRVTPTATLPATVTPTPGPLVSGAAILNPGDQYDLDTNRIDPAGADILYSSGDQGLWLDPVNGASLAVFGSNGPTLTNCQTTTLSADRLALANLPAGVYLCYRTNQGHSGWAQFVSLDADNELHLEIYTWAVP